MAQLSVIPVDPSAFKSSARRRKATADVAASAGDAAAAERHEVVKDKCESSESIDPKPSKQRKQLSACLTACKYDCVRRVCKRYGLRTVAESDDWNLYWTDLSVSVDRVMDVRVYQKINHFPGIPEISRKDFLARNMMRMHRQFPEDYNIAPMSWTLPADYGDFIAFSSKSKNRGVSYIAKPDNSSQGKGIFVTNNSKDIKSDLDCVVQLYIDRPFLVDGYKFDMRVYVLVTSCDPLRIYVYKDGLARFATIKYHKPTSQNTSQSCMHLTNYSINKLSSEFVHDDIAGSKRRLIAMDDWFIKNGHDVRKIWRDIEDVVIKTIISCHPVLKHSYQVCFPQHPADCNACFEILGFDVMLDRDLKPWLIEVNHSPSYHTDQEMDRDIKEGLLFDALSMLNLESLDRAKYLRDEKQRAHDRLTKQLKDASQSRIKSSGGASGKRREHSATPAKVKQSTADEEAHGTAKPGTSTQSADETHGKESNKMEEETPASLFELKNSGGWRRAFPFPGCFDMYSKFFAQASSLHTQTAASKARQKSIKDQQDEIAAKQQQQLQHRRSSGQLPLMTGLPFRRKFASIPSKHVSHGDKNEDGFDPKNYPQFVLTWDTGDAAVTENAELQWRSSLGERSHLMQALGMKSLVSQYFRTASLAARQLNLTDTSQSAMTSSVSHLADINAKQRRPGGGGGGIHPRNTTPEGVATTASHPAQLQSSRDPLPPVKAEGITLFHFKQPAATASRINIHSDNHRSKFALGANKTAELSVCHFDHIQLPADKLDHSPSNALSPRPLGSRRQPPREELWVPGAMEMSPRSIHVAPTKSVLPNIPKTTPLELAQSQTRLRSTVALANSDNAPVLVTGNPSHPGNTQLPRRRLFDSRHHTSGNPPAMSLLQPQLLGDVSVVTERERDKMTARGTQHHSSAMLSKPFKHQRRKTQPRSHAQQQQQQQ
eukprot:scpid36550/ scgid1439/ Tubulin polyglutamylase TTLL6; Tubulin--tyrosine ligase-like protein 6